MGSSIRKVKNDLKMSKQSLNMFCEYDSAMTGQQDVWKMIKVSPCLFSEATLQNCEQFLSEWEVAGMCLSCRDCVQGRTEGQVSTVSSSHQEE